MKKSVIIYKMTPIALHKNDMPGQLSKRRKFQVSSFELHVVFFPDILYYFHTFLVQALLCFSQSLCVWGKNEQMKQPVAMKLHVFVL